MSNEEGDPPASTFTPIPLETLDWDQAIAAISAVELKLAMLKRDLIAAFQRAEEAEAGEEEVLGGS